MDASPSTNFTTQLRQERIRRNWRQQDLADQLGTTAITIKRWERGRQQPSAYFRVKLCFLFSKSAEELGLVDVGSAATTEREASVEVHSPTDVPSLWNVPYSRNPHFTGRDELFEQLNHYLSPERLSEPITTRQAALTQTQAIKGLGGIGKTQIAVEYAYRADEQKRYTHAFWINAANEETILISFMALAELLPSSSVNKETDQRKLVRAVTNWLEQCPQRWLLIFDNADDLSLAQQYLPLQGHGSILFTTRSHAVGSFAASIEVEIMGLVEGTQFLLHRTQRLQVTDEEANEATNVVIALDGFPLALDQAGAFIEETGCSFSAYLALYQEHRHTLLARRGMQTTRYPDSVATTWSLSFQKIKQANPAAAELLHLCAFLAPDHIPEELLTDGSPYWIPLLQPATADLLAFNHMIEALLAFSLVKRLAEDRILSIHRLVQAVQMDMMDPEEQHQWSERIVRAVNAVFPRYPKEDVTSWPHCLRYLEQVQACDTLIQKHQLVLPEAADLLDRSGTYLSEHASYTLAELLFLRALHLRESVLGLEHSEVAFPLNNLAILYRQQGKYAEAEPIFLRVLRIREPLGPEHPLLASPLNSLGILYNEQGKYTQAEPLFLRALHIWEQQLGLEHPQVASPLNNLGNLYYDQGKYAQAEPLYLRALHIREQQLGPEHPQVAYPLYGLACLYYDQGKYAQAELFFLRALHIREQQLGPEHPLLAYSLNGLANLYENQGKYTQAEPLYLRALHIWEQQLGLEHPMVAHPLNGLANLYQREGKYTKAESLYKRAVHIREQTLELQHPDIAEGLHDFAVFREARGNSLEAVGLYQRALAIREHVYGPQSPKTTETRERLCMVLVALDRIEEATALNTKPPEQEHQVTAPTTVK